jgi:predicted permease
MVVGLTDVRYGLRMLKKSPGFTAVAVFTLALGIGANSSIFSIINEVFLRPVPLAKDPSRLVALGRSLDGREWNGFTHSGYLAYRKQNQVFSGLMGYRGADMNLTGGGAQRINATLVTGNYFTVLGINAFLGRTFLPEEDQTPGSHPVAVISYGLWTSRFGSDQNLVGKSLTLNGRGFTVVGIAPRGFTGIESGESTDVWVPLMMEGVARPLFPVINSGDFFSSLTVVGRLNPGISFAQAQAEMSVLAHALEETDPTTKKQKQVILSPNVRFPDPEWRAYARIMTAPLIAAVALVLLIACANVANLLLARTSARSREIAVRLALGASRVQLVRQFLTEGMLLSLLGGLLGVFVGMIPSRLSQVFWGPLDLSPDGRVLGFTFLISLLTGMIMGFAPAMQSSKPDLVPALKDGAPQGGYRGFKLRSLLVILQVALSMVLAVGAGLLVKTLRNRQAIDLGFETKHLLIVPLELRPMGYAENRVRSLQRLLVDRLVAFPGVLSVSLAHDPPVSGLLSGPRKIFTEGQESGLGIPVDYDEVAPRYFETLGVSLVRGRDFTDKDRQGSPGVAIISESMARRVWPGEDPIGKHFRLIQFISLSPYQEVVGVVKDTRYRRLEQKPTPHLYLPFAQNFQVSATVLIRIAVKPNALAQGVRREVVAMDPSLPPPDVRTMADHVSDADSDQKGLAALMSLFGFLALVLASVGVYALMSSAVSQRKHEIGIRMALGADRRDVLKLIVGRALFLTLAGIAIGLTAALALAREISSILYGVSSTDSLTYACVSLLLTAVALFASYIPARRAVKMNPMVVLREQ